MADAIDDLTKKEREALRLMLAGHDAKSAARELDLSVHAINDRLRSARRKLSVTSSREAARMLLEAEGPPPELLVGKALGDDPAAPATNASHQSEALHSEGRDRWRMIAGFLGILLMLAIVLATALSMGAATDHPPSASEIEASALAAEQTLNPQAEEAARTFLTLIDAGDWQASFAEMGTQMQEANTIEGWTAASQQARGSLGEMISRHVVSSRFVNAPPNGYREIKFATKFANDTDIIETVTLQEQDGEWKVVGLTIE